MRLLLLAPLAAAVIAAPAHAGFRPGGPTPDACSGPGFSDAVGSLASDVVAGASKPQRIYGLTGADWLVGSATRASCLFGGQGDDVLTLGAGGGVALGEDGRDLLTGSDKTDALSGGDGADSLLGGASADVVRGGRGVDALDGGPGDDILDAQDGRAEVVSCGDGTDTAYADRADVLLLCEQLDLEGGPLRRKRLNREVGTRATAFRAAFVAPEAAEAGGYRVVVAAPGCAGGALEPWRSATALARGERTRMTLSGPWCPGAYAGAVVRARACPAGRACAVPPPSEPIAWLAFVVR